MGGGPIRSCAGCRRRRPQPELVRIAAGPGGVVAVDAWDPESRRSIARRLPGRGTYVCPARDCIERAWKTRALERALGREERIPERVLSDLLALIE